MFAPTVQSLKPSVILERPSAPRRTACDAAEAPCVGSFRNSVYGPGSGDPRKPDERFRARLRCGTGGSPEAAPISGHLLKTQEV